MNLQQAQQVISDMNAHKIVWDDNLRAQANNVISSGGGNSGGNTDFAAQAEQIAKNAQQMQMEANAPAISTLQGQQGNLQQAYASLLQSVLGQGTVATNYAQRAENTLLGQRGITDNTSALYNQQMASNLLPYTQANQTAIANVGIGSATDLNQLAANIASLQAGNVPGALSFGQNVTGIGANYQQALAQIAGQIQQAQIGSAAQIHAAQIGQQYQQVAPSNTLFNTANNQYVKPGQLPYAQGFVS